MDTNTELQGMADRDNFNDFDDDDQDDGYMTFDARDEGEDRSRGPLVIAAIVAVLAICGVILWQLYAGSRESGDTPIVAADNGSFKAAPSEVGGTQNGDLDKGVFDAANGVGAPPLDVQPNTAGAEDPLLADGDVVPTPAPAVVPAPRPVAVTPAPAPKPQPKEPQQVQRATQAPAPAPKPVVKPKPAPVQVAQATPRTTPATAPTSPKAVPVTTQPVSTPVAVPSSSSSSSTPTPKAVPAPRPSGSGIAAQLGSFQTRASADTALARYRASGLSGPVSVVSADLGEKGTWYRIRATGFDTRAEVEGFCAKARSAGAQCIPSGR
jgi:outer membrane biosynthesis protein TonB